MAEFHPHWYLTAPETLPPIDPRLLVLEPRIDRPRGRPMGAINRLTSQEQASTQETSIHRDPSKFEVILREGRGRSRVRGRGRGRGRSSQLNSQISGAAASQLTDHLPSKSAGQPINEPEVQRERGRGGYWKWERWNSGGDVI
jgi:hypothetical protein